MASDYGDESGEKILDSFTRFGERMGEAAMRGRASRMQRAFEDAKAGAGEQAADEPPGTAGPTEWAKLDMAEFREIEGYGEIKQIIEEKLRAHGVEATWFEDKAAGKEYLLFRVADAREVRSGFDELSHEAGPAAEKAAGKLKERVREGRDERPLEVRAEQAREASGALEAERSGARSHAREPRFQELRSK